MNYSLLMRGLLDECLLFSHYKSLSRPAKVFMAIATAPVILLGAVLVAAYYCLLFLYQAFSMPADSLEAWVKNQKQEVKHATEAVIYLISMPFIFASRVMLAMLSVVFYFLWFELMVVAYIATLGGIRWQPFINCARFDEPCEKDPCYVGVFNAFAIINFAIFVQTIVLFILAQAFSWVYGWYKLFAIASAVMICLVYPISFARKWKTFQRCVITLVLCMAVVFASAIGIVASNGDLRFDINIGGKQEENVLTISGYNTYISDGTYANRTDITKVVIEEGVVTIGSSAFDGCTNLSEVVLPSSLKYIDSYAFYGCSSLTRVVIPYGVSEISSYAFYGCTSLTYVDMSKGVSRIADGAFKGCSSLGEVRLGMSLSYVGYNAFADCYSLSYVAYSGSYTDWMYNVYIDDNNDCLTDQGVMYNTDTYN